jgi:hypothetical protein
MKNDKISDTVKIFAGSPIRVRPSEDFIILVEREDGNYEAVESWRKKEWAERTAIIYRHQHKKKYVVVDKNYVPIP